LRVAGWGRGVSHIVRGAASSTAGQASLSYKHNLRQQLANDVRHTRRGNVASDLNRTGFGGGYGAPRPTEDAAADAALLGARGRRPVRRAMGMRADETWVDPKGDGRRLRPGRRADASVGASPPGTFAVFTGPEGVPASQARGRPILSDAIAQQGDRNESGGHHPNGTGRPLISSPASKTLATSHLVGQRRWRPPHVPRVVGIRRPRDACKSDFAKRDFLDEGSPSLRARRTFLNCALRLSRR